jgi:adenosyl cobinamide kinase/adenosyl cobinamide phosphate guanylyltransferase
MRTFSPKDITERTVETYQFTGDWQKILGEPDIRFSTLIRGEAKSGKSTYCAKFAQYVSQFGRVLYISAEERLNSKTLQQRLKHAGVTSQNVRFIHEKNLDKIKQQIKNGKYRFIIFDSVQHIQMNYNDFEAMRHEFKRRKISWHLIMQMGVNITQWKHEVDVLIEVKQGRAQVHGRYNAANSIEVFKQHNQQTSLFEQS